MLSHEEELLVLALPLRLVRPEGLVVDLDANVMFGFIVFIVSLCIIYIYIYIHIEREMFKCR